jgi:hypothetical protein
MVAAAGARLGVRLEQVDGNGLLPLAAHEPRLRRAPPRSAAHWSEAARRAPGDAGPTPLAKLPPSAATATCRGEVLRAGRPADAGGSRPALIACRSITAAPVGYRGRRSRPPRPARGASSAGLPATPTSATSRPTAPRAACRRTCTSATSRHARRCARGGRARGLDASRARRPAQGGTRRLVGHERRGRGVPRRAGHLARARLQLLHAPRRLRSLRVAAAVGPATWPKHAADPRPQLYTLDELEAATPTTRCGTPRSASCCARAGSTTTCGCCGARRSSSGRHARAGPRAR